MQYTYTIEYYNKDKGFELDSKIFDSYKQAEKWGIENIENFSHDLIHIK